MSKSSIEEIVKTGCVRVNEQTLYLKRDLEHPLYLDTQRYYGTLYSGEKPAAEIESGDSGLCLYPYSLDDRWQRALKHARDTFDYCCMTRSREMPEWVRVELVNRAQTQVSETLAMMKAGNRGDVIDWESVLEPVKNDDEETNRIYWVWFNLMIAWRVWRDSKDADAGTWARFASTLYEACHRHDGKWPQWIDGVRIGDCAAKMDLLSVVNPLSSVYNRNDYLITIWKDGKPIWHILYDRNKSPYDPVVLDAR